MAKFKIEWSREARQDLINILEYYIKRNGSFTYSIKLNAKIKKSLKLIGNNVYLGKATNYNSIRTFITVDYQIIYEIFDEFVLVIMIWDCRRNPEDRTINLRIKE